MPGKRKIVALMLTLLLALALLSGCGGMLKNETLEKQLDIIVTAMNTDDEDLLYNAFYPGMSRVNFDDSYKEMQAFWEGSGEYTKEPVNINITSGNGTKVYEGEYVVAFEEKSYIVTLAYVEDEGGKGLRNVHFREGGMESVSDAVVSGSFRTAGKNSPAQWGLLALTVAEWGFVLFTLVDIFRNPSCTACGRCSLSLPFPLPLRLGASTASGSPLGTF